MDLLAPIWLVSGSKTGLGPRGGDGGYVGGVRAAGGGGVGAAGGGGVPPRPGLEGGEAGVSGFSLSLSGASSEQAKWCGGRRAVAKPVSRTTVC